MKRLTVFVVVFLWAALRGGAQETKAVPSADERYKADILLVVAHPDDEGAATPYLARALEEGKHVAVAFGTRGSSGANEAGAEQAAALGAIREIEARRALTPLGITNVWFLGGKDTATQNVLQSLANWEHAAALEQLVRLVRFTRPGVVLTLLPGTVIGEEHGGQVAAPMRRLEPFLENLRPWQCKKIYYFPDATNDEMFRGKGPEYSVKDISKSAKQAYWRLALESFRAHQTQAKGYLDSLSKISEAELEKKAGSDGWGDAQHFVLGKSLVGGSVTGDIFENVKPGGIAFVRPNASPAPALPEVSVALAGPWSFYDEFRRAHGL